MEFDDFPLQRVPDVAQSSVAQHCGIDELLRWSICSNQSRDAIRKSNIRTKQVKIEKWSLDVTLRNNSRLRWHFFVTGNKLANYSFRNLIKTAIVDDSIWKTRCKDPNAAIMSVFCGLDSLFKIRELTEFDLHIMPATRILREHQILRTVDRIQAITVHIHVAVAEEELEWMLNKFAPFDFLKIKHGKRLVYSKPMPCAKRMLLDDPTAKYFRPAEMTTNICTHLIIENHANEGHITQPFLNNLLHEWKKGSMPCLQVMEVLNASDQESLFDGLGATPWDRRREAKFNMSIFYYYANLKHFTHNLCFRDGKDIISNDHKTEATVVPTNLSDFHSFVFVVWNDWIPLPFRKPSRSHRPE